MGDLDVYYYRDGIIYKFLRFINIFVVRNDDEYLFDEYLFDEYLFEVRIL